jgi:hypothetical protein
MTNINQLEQEWKDYKKKQQAPFIISFAIISIIFILIITIFSGDSSKKPTKPINKVVEQKADPIKPTIVEVTKKPVVQVQELQPSFNFMKHINQNDKSVKSYKNSQRIKHKTTYSKNNDSSRKVNHKKNYTREKKSVQNFSMNASSAKSKVDSLALRFNDSRDPNLGIVVAKQYLQLKKYKKAYFYALEVNTIDRKNEESWIVTAKALYFLKRKDAALKLLKGYINKNDSAEAIRVFRAIQQGRLK